MPGFQSATICQSKSQKNNLTKEFCRAYPTGRTLSFMYHLLGKPEKNVIFTLSQMAENRSG